MPNAAQQHYFWHTHDELAFIAALAAQLKPPERPSPLERYAQALRKRADWRGLDRAAIAADLAARGWPI